MRWLGLLFFLHFFLKNIKKVLDIGIYLCYYNINKGTQVQSKEEKIMKAYANGKKATEFNKYQIIELSKNVNIERWFFDHLMNMAGYYGYDDSKEVEREEALIIAAINEENSVEQLKKLNQAAEKTIRAYGLNRSNLNHNIVGQEPEVTEEDAEKAIKSVYANCSINFTEEGCEFKFDSSKKRAKTYTYNANSFKSLAKKLNIRVA
jgi:hypothetical protein